MNRIALPLFAALLVTQCGPEAPPGPVSLVPANYTSTFVEVRRCRSTIDHASFAAGDNVRNIRVWVSRDASQAYINNAATLPPGAVVIKEEYGGSCNSADLLAWTVMRKEPGFDPPRGDWRWQRVRAPTRAVLEDGRVQRCISCHDTTACRARDWQCTERQMGDP